MSVPKRPSNIRVLLFIVTLSFVCALVLSLLASVLAKPQEIARELDRSRQMLIAARILNPAGFFQLQNEEEEYVPAQFEKGGILVSDKAEEKATDDQVLAVYRRRIRPLLVNDEGDVSTFAKTDINEIQYLQDFRKTGYYKEPWKLLYEILPNPKEGEKPDEKEPAIGYVIPVNGYGLWDAIYGYLAITPNGDTVIGISWYDQKETPGLGAVITDPAWQKQFHGKLLFQEMPSGQTDFQTAPLGVTVVKGKVAEVLGDNPKAKSAVDGIAGATLTGNGVTIAYHDVLTAYRPFLIKLHEKEQAE